MDEKTLELLSMVGLWIIPALWGTISLYASAPLTLVGTFILMTVWNGTLRAHVKRFGRSKWR